ncbi:unnamed protein product [Owenia fusiformis]|uniref:Glutamyl-tRNA(Gln) amidotransferase subunit A, mitochondrial n=1 Tax=Owenia fusiformis TaxID=6347 RepID=A0A8J1TDR3_OWEFU|nr:unnamed protein product [Owenia fusiformis]
MKIGRLKEALSLLKTRQKSVAELYAECLSRAKHYEILNFLTTATFDDFEGQRENSEKLFKSGDHVRTLEGIPVAVKDNFCTTGVKTSCSSHMLNNFYPPYNATVVQKFIDNGAYVMGKTNMDEFAMGSGTVDSIHGPVRNPWTFNLPDVSDITEIKESDWLIAGGSSGGSAVAVATGSCYAAMGSDTGGSTRNPAAYCGIVGLKPTYGLVSRHGLIPLVNSLDVPGIMTRSAEDAAAVLNVLAGHDILDSTTLQTPHNHIELDAEPNVADLHIGIPKEYHAPGLSAEMLAQWDKVIEMFEKAGAKISSVSLPHSQYSIVCYTVLCAAEVASNMARYDGLEYGKRATEAEKSTEMLYATSRHQGLNEVVRGRILAGNYFLLRRNYDQYFMQAQRVRRLITEDFNNVYSQGIDLLLTPTTLTDAPSFGEFTSEDNMTQSQQQDVFTQPVNLAGLPAVTVPVGLSPRGLPLGLQFIGKLKAERTILNAAKWLEAQVDFPYFKWEKKS